MVDKLEYLKIIQDVIKRMADNSFLLKGWAITLVSGLFGISAWNDVEYIFYCLIYIPIIVFWFLDSYYLRQERLYRGLYDRVRMMKSDKLEESNYSMAPPKPDDQIYKDYDKKKYSFIRVLFSRTEAGLYLSVVFLLTIIIFCMAIKTNCCG